MQENNNPNNNRLDENTEDNNIQDVNDNNSNIDSETEVGLDLEKENRSDNIDDEDENQSSFKMPENINISEILIWGVSGFILSAILIFIVSLIAGTLSFILGRLLIFGIIFFIIGAGLRFLLEAVSPELFSGETNEEEEIPTNIPMDSDMENEEADIGGNIDTSIDDQIETDPLWTKEPEEEEKKKEEENKQEGSNERLKKKYGEGADYIKVEGTDVVFPNNAELMAEGIRTMINNEDENK
ncbi:MAG: hypothetical protein ACOCV8_03230 [Spirochaetota bacterium]